MKTQNKAQNEIRNETRSKDELLQTIVKARSLAIRTSVRAGVVPTPGGSSGKCGAGVCG